MHQLPESAQELGESAQAEGPLVNSEPPSKRFHVNLDCQDIWNCIALPSRDETDDRKYQVITGHFVLDTMFFQKLLVGTVFSEVVNQISLVKIQSKGRWQSLSCLCTLSSTNRANPGVLVKTAVNDFKRRLEKLCQHSDKEYHKRPL